MLKKKSCRPQSPHLEGLTDSFFRSPYEQKVVQARLDGFTFNKLKPYENWEMFRDEGRELWEFYLELAHPLRVNRIALRYVNRIEVPLPFGDFNEYILTNPQVAPKLPQSLSSFFMRIQIPFSDQMALATITQTMEKPTESQKLPLIIDIDVVRQSNFTKDAFSEIWDGFEELRIVKNDIFFNSITEKAQELFK